ASFHKAPVHLQATLNVATKNFAAHDHLSQLKDCFCLEFDLAISQQKHNVLFLGWLIACGVQCANSEIRKAILNQPLCAHDYLILLLLTPLPLFPRQPTTFAQPSSDRVYRYPRKCRNE